MPNLSLPILLTLSYIYFTSIVEYPTSLNIKNENITISQQITINTADEWIIETVSDDFGDQVKGYITNNIGFKGHYDNGLPTGVGIKAYIFVRNSNRISLSIRLYRSENFNPTWDIEFSKSYKVQIKDNLGNITVLRATFSKGQYRINDKLVFNQDDSYKFHSILMKGGNIKISCKDDTKNENFMFQINIADSYKPTYLKFARK